MQVNWFRIDSRVLLSGNMYDIVHFIPHQEYRGIAAFPSLL
jgi:hypothetical protein